jgi:UDP-glucose 4-epimerase
MIKCKTLRIIRLYRLTHCIELIKAGYKVVVVDNLRNSSLESLKRVEKLAESSIPFHKVDVRDKMALARVFENTQLME